MSTVTEADWACAISFRQSGFAGWMDGVQTEAWLVEKLAQFAAIAREAGERAGAERENRACEEIARAQCSCSDCREDFCKPAESIAARRRP